MSGSSGTPSRVSLTMKDNAVGLRLLIRLTCLKQARLFCSQPLETTSRGRSPIFHLGTRLVAVKALSHLHSVTLCISLIS